MNLDDAISALINRDPSRSYCARKTVWAHEYDGKHMAATIYAISIMPGVDGAKCTSAEGPTVEAALSAAMTFFALPHSDTNQE